MSVEIVQGSPEWFASRLGKVTASRVADLAATTKTGWGASRGNYMAELIVERLTGQTAPSYVNAAMQHGIDFEAQARAAYEFYSDAAVERVPLIDHPRIAMSGASPDGLVGEDGLIEVKCPESKTHIETLLGASIPGKYRLQMMWQMSCTGRKWCDFASFDPRMPAHLQLFVRRLDRDDTVIAALESQVSEFLAELDSKVAKLQAL